MALALADSIARVGWDLNDQGRRYVAWWQKGEYSVNGKCFDIGITTRHALGRFLKTGDARISGDPSSRASGNGLIMRLAPVPIRYAELFPDRLDELIRLCVESSLPTHASPQCLSACAYFGLLLAGLIHGLPREEVLSRDCRPLRQLKTIHPLHPEIEEVAAGSFRTKQPPEIRGSGYVVHSLEAALWAFHDAKDYRGRAMDAWSAGGDGIYLFNCFNPRHPLWWELGDPAKLRTMDKLYFVTVCDGSPDRYLANGDRHQTVPILTPGRSMSLSPSQPVRVSTAVGDDLALAQQKRPKPVLTCHLQMPSVSRVEQLLVKFNGHAVAGGTVNGGWVDMPLQPAWAKLGMNQLEVSVQEADVASKAWDVECVCTEKLPAPWARGRGTNNTSTAMRDGALVIADKGTGQGSYLYYSYPWGADPARPALVEATAKVLTGKSAIIVANGVAEQEVRLYPDKISTRHAGLTYAMDTTDTFHTYRVEIQGQDIRMFVDGVLRLDGVGKFTYPASSARNAVLFGAASSGETGEACWHAIRVRSGSHLLNDVVLSVRYR